VTLQAEEVPPGYVWNKSSDKRVALGTPATAVEPKGAYVLMKNLWYNNGRCARFGSCLSACAQPPQHQPRLCMQSAHEWQC
jgi:hypothetical protein